MEGEAHSDRRSDPRSRGELRKLFYEMYPNSDPKYYSYFEFGENVDGEKLKSIDVLYKHNLKYKDYLRIIKGENDEDPR